MKPSEEAYIDAQNAKAVERQRKLKLAREYVRTIYGDIVLPDWALLAWADHLEARDERP